MCSTVQTFVICLATLISIVESRSTKGIIGGTEASITNFPYHVSIRRKGEHDCGGSIIDEQHILTAAHCIVDKNGDLITDLSILGGTANYKLNPPNGQTHQPDVITLHNDYTVGNRRLHDIAIIKLLKPIVFSPLQRPVALPTSDVSIGVTATAIGSGWINDRTRETPDVLQKLETTVIDNKKCQEIWQFGGVTISPEDICFWKSTTQGICNGDSGSPLIYRGYIIGVISFSTTNCSGVFPDISVRVSKYVPWIRSVLAGKPGFNIYYPRYLYIA